MGFTRCVMFFFSLHESSDYFMDYFYQDVDPGSSD